jgi:hypothetical protein
VGHKKPKRKAESGPKSAVTTPSRAPARSAPRLTSMVPVRFEPAMLVEIRRRADEDGRSVSAWIRRTVEVELRRDDTL